MKNFTQEELERALNEVNKLYFENSLTLKEALKKVKGSKNE